MITTPTNIPSHSNYYLARRIGFGMAYYVSSGVRDFGTAEAVPFLDVSRRISAATGFRTLRRARRMAEALLMDRGVLFKIVNREGEVIES